MSAQEVALADVAEVSAHEAALAEVAEVAAKRASWQVRRHDAAQELAALRAASGASVLDDEDGASTAALAARIAELEATVDLAEKALAEAAGRDLAARRRAIAAEADELEPQLEQAQVRVNHHLAKAARLLAALEAFTGATYLPVSPDPIFGAEAYRIVPGHLPTLEPVATERDAISRRLGLLRAAAAGESLRDAVPDAGFADLTDSLHPVTGLLPAAGFIVPTITDWAALAGEAEEAASRLQNQVEHIEALRADPVTRSRGMDFDLPLAKHRLDEALMKMHTYRGWARAQTDGDFAPVLAGA